MNFVIENFVFDFQIICCFDVNGLCYMFYLMVDCFVEVFDLDVVKFWFGK